MGFLTPDYADPTSPEYRKRLEALTVRGPETGSAFRGAEEATFGALKGAGEVGREQADLARALRAQAEGRAPSLAGMQFARALEQSQAAAASQLASARGLSPAQAQQILATQTAAARQGAASQSAMLRLQEQQAAQQALGNLLGQQRQQELLGGQLAAGLYGTAGGLGMEQARLQQAAQQMVMNQAAQEQAQRTALLTAGLSAIGTGVGLVSQKAKGGAIVPGKAKFKGDTRSNDTVPAMLSPGEIVLPRTVAQSEDAPDKAKRFVEELKKKKKPSPRDYMAALSRLEELESRLNAMEALQDLEAEAEG